MAHFAKIENNIVIEVIVLSDDYESIGHDYLANTLGLGGEWVQTSYNSKIRKNFAGTGYSYDRKRDAFIPPKSFNSWVLDEETCQWQAPLQYPNDGFSYEWNEEITSWDKVE